MDGFGRIIWTVGTVWTDIPPLDGLKDGLSFILSFYSFLFFIFTWTETCIGILIVSVINGQHGRTMCQYAVSNATLIVSNCVILLTGTGLSYRYFFFFLFYSFLLFPCLRCLLCVRDAPCCDSFYVCKVTRFGRRRMLVLVLGVWECGGEIPCLWAFVA